MGRDDLQGKELRLLTCYSAIPDYSLGISNQTQEHLDARQNSKSCADKIILPDTDEGIDLITRKVIRLCASADPRSISGLIMPWRLEN